MRTAAAAMGVVSVLLFGTCTKEDARREQAAAAPRGHGDLRAMVVELAAARACTMLRGQYRELRARGEAVTGVLWVRECAATVEGAKTTFRIVANGWQRAERGEVRFGAKATIAGSLDVAYAQHVARARFSPVAPPDVALTFAGDAAVDRAAVTASVLGALAGAVSDASPARLADGVTLAIDLCTGAGRFELGTRGSAPRPTTQVTAVVWPGAVVMSGPQLSSPGVTVDAEAIQGAVRVGVVCAAEAAAVAQRMLDGKPGEVPFLASMDLHARGRLRIPHVACPVVMVAHSLETTGGPATFTWQRPAAEIVQAAEGPLVQCAQ